MKGVLSFLLTFSLFSAILQARASILPEFEDDEDIEVTTSASEITDTHNEYGNLDANKIQQEYKEQLRVQAANEIRKMLNITNTTGKPLNPPQFMYNLYNTVAYPNGTPRGPAPYYANLVRSFVEEGPSHSNIYSFEISKLEEHETVLGAELHLHLTQTPENIHSKRPKSSNYSIKVYQVLEGTSSGSHKLLTSQEVDAGAYGIQTFDVKQAVLAWFNGEPNLGLLISVCALSDGMEYAENYYKYEDDVNSRAILVLFDDNGTGKNQISGQGYADVPNDLTVENPSERVRREIEDPRNEGKRIFSDREKYANAPTSLEIYQQAMSKKKREVAKSKKSRTVKKTHERTTMSPHNKDFYTYLIELKELKTTSGDARPILELVLERFGDRRKRKELPSSDGCSRRPFVVDFGLIGMDENVISPKTYDAYYCEGDCTVPFMYGTTPTFHAVLQTYAHQAYPAHKKPISACCAPSNLSSIMILFAVNNTAILKTIENMAVASCGCH